MSQGIDFLVLSFTGCGIMQRAHAAPEQLINKLCVQCKEAMAGAKNGESAAGYEAAAARHSARACRC